MRRTLGLGLLTRIDGRQIRLLRLRRGPRITGFHHTQNCRMSFAAGGGQVAGAGHVEGGRNVVHAPCETAEWRRGQEICGQDRPADTWFRLISGAARRSVVRIDGRRQIVDLLLPGDVFGFSAAPEYDYAVEAVAEGTRTACYPRRRVEHLADADPRLARELRELAFAAISRLQAQLVLIGRVTAREKVGSFLVELGSRLTNSHSDRVELPISRYDIADYLALSVETVSRSLTELKQRGLIRFVGTRQIKIVDRAALEDGMFDEHGCGRHLPARAAAARPPVRAAA
jgi:CRP-like cAMP-binding protein